MYLSGWFGGMLIGGYFKPVVKGKEIIETRVNYIVHKIKESSQDES